MDDTDDYFYDDFVLDDDTLAVLNREEQKYLQENNSTAFPDPSQPVNKRHKTSNGWVPGVGASMDVQDDFDELPEISVQGDGTYGIGSRVNPTAGQAPRLTIPFNAPSRTERIPPAQSQLLEPILTSVDSPTISTLTTQHGPTNATPRNVQVQPPPMNATTSNKSLSDNPQAQLIEMQQMLRELREENTKIQSSLKGALSAKTVKEGEISVLRKGIEKSAQSHAAQVAQLKNDKRDADSKQTQIQKDMRDELERLKTQLKFKQQELESSVRKPPSSTRSVKHLREMPSTPFPVPPKMRNWNDGRADKLTSGNSDDRTPMRPRYPPLSRGSPSKARKSPEKTRKSTMLPGFQNAFDTSTPVQSPRRRPGKGKERININPGTAASSQPPLTFEPVLQRPPSQSQPDLDDIFGGAMVSDSQESATRLPTEMKDDSEPIKAEESDEDIQFEDLGNIEPINWCAEMSRIILTHSHPRSQQITFQELLESSSFLNTAPDFSENCARILETIANARKVDSLEEAMQTVSRSFLSLLRILGDTQQLQYVARQLNLITTLVLALPNFQACMLASRIPTTSDDAPISLSEVICKLVLNNLKPPQTHAHADLLFEELLSFLEALCFRTSQDCFERLEDFLRNREVLLTLFHEAQPPWMLQRCSRLLALLATHHALHRPLLSISHTMEINTEQPFKDPFTERLCSILADSFSIGAIELKANIMILFSQLSTAHDEAHAALASSPALIPSLVLYTSHLTTILWEDANYANSSITQTLPVVESLGQTLFLLYRLIFVAEPCINLQRKLQFAPRSYNNINHLFVVTFGRLSYCEPPTWIDTAGRLELENLVDISKEILEVVVDGPEIDSVWAAFQTETDEDCVTDEGEMEAQLMGIDN